MFEVFMTFLRGSVEWQGYQAKGLWNASALSSIFIFVMSLFEIWGMIMQSWTIWKKRSGESVSVALFNYTCWYFVACGVYGIYINSAVMALNGVVTGLMQLPILVGLIRYKRFALWEIFFSLACILAPVAIVYADSHRALLFLLLGAGSGIAFGMQPWELWKTKKTGAADIRLFAVYTVTASVWMVFSLTVGDIPFIINQLVGTTMVIVATCMWCWYRVHEPSPPAALAPLSVFVRRAPL